MAKRQLYAPAEIAASLAAAILTLFPALAQAGTSSQDAPCAACVAIAVEPAAVSSLPQQLGGVEVFVRVTTGLEGKVEAALIDIERRGGRPGLLMSGLPVDVLSGRVLERVRQVLIDPGIRPAELTDDESAFQLQ